jgi:hypothetical protein
MEILSKCYTFGDLPGFVIIISAKIESSAALGKPIFNLCSFDDANAFE